MAVFIDHKQRVENYFIAWKNYDIQMLRAIFSQSAKYIIRRKKTYNGIEEIVEYWKKNAKRQKSIQLHWKIITSSYRCEVVQFGAYFWDLETNLYTKVNGQIIFKYDCNNQIIRLTETYKKRTKESTSINRNIQIKTEYPSKAIYRINENSERKLYPKESHPMRYFRGR